MGSVSHLHAPGVSEWATSLWKQHQLSRQSGSSGTEALNEPRPTDQPRIRAGVCLADGFFDEGHDGGFLGRGHLE